MVWLGLAGLPPLKVALEEEGKMLTRDPAVFGGLADTAIMHGQFGPEVGCREVPQHLLFSLHVGQGGEDARLRSCVAAFCGRKQRPNLVTSDRLLGGEDHRPLDDVAQLAHVPPTGRPSLSSRTRSSLTCNGSGSSPISSRKTLPPSASSISPGLLDTAPVNAPRTWPNNSLSIIPSGTVVQSITW